MKILMTDKNGITLKTAGKYCTEDIVITHPFENVGMLQDITITHNGVYTPAAGFDGFSTVNVSMSLAGERFAIMIAGSGDPITITAEDLVGATAIAENAFLNLNLANTSFEIPENITSIGPSAFQNCKGLQSLVIPATVTNLGHNVTSYSSITNLTLHVSTVPWLQNSSNLVTVVLGDEVTSIRDMAFYNCTGLQHVYLPVVPPPIAAGDEPFRGSNSNITFHCQTAESLAAYKAASGWGTLTNTHTFQIG